MSRIVERPAALRDLDGIFDYITEESESRAVAFIRRIRDRLELLAENPLLGRSREELRPNLRSIPIGRYVIFYRPLPEREGVEVIRVLHASRDIEAVLGERDHPSV